MLLLGGETVKLYVAAGYVLKLCKLLGMGMLENTIGGTGDGRQLVENGEQRELLKCNVPRVISCGQKALSCKSLGDIAEEESKRTCLTVKIP